MKHNKVIDLFAGVGGMSLGFEMAGFDVVLANEYDKEIAEAYIKNHPNTKMIAKDITSLSLEETFSEYRGKIDVIIGVPYGNLIIHLLRQSNFFIIIIRLFPNNHCSAPILRHTIIHSIQYI